MLPTKLYNILYMDRKDRWKKRDVLYNSNKRSSHRD